jgi:hypothetical protein
MTLNWNFGTQRLQGTGVSIAVQGGQPLTIPDNGRVSICANNNGYWGGYLGGSPGTDPDQTANTGTFVAQATTGGQTYGTLLSWHPGRSGLPKNLFQPHCVIGVSSMGPNSISLSWPYGGGGGGTCTLGPLPQVIPHSGQPPAEAQLTIPNQPPQQVGVNAEAAVSPRQTNTHLTSHSFQEAGIFTTLDPI